MLGTLGTILSGVGIGWLSKSGRMKEKADAYKKMGEAYQYRIDALHESLGTCNKTIDENQKQIAKLNHALNEKEDEKRKIEADKTEQIRKLTEQMYQSEQEVNRVQNLLNDAKDEITRLTEERDNERAAKEYYKQWRCTKSICKDPEGRRPPNSKLATQVYKDPERREISLEKTAK